jgi:hypothetical protein
MDEYLGTQDKRQSAARRLGRMIKPLMGHLGNKPYPITSAERYMKLFTKAPICEICGDETAISFACFDGFSNWKFCGNCTRDIEFYTIPIADFFARPASVVDWLGHMDGKHDMDWASFGRMMNRFSEATGSEGGEGPHFRPA